MQAPLVAHEKISRRKPSNVFDKLDNLGLPIRNIGRGQLFRTLTERGEKAKETNNFAISRGIPRSLVI